MFSLDYRRYVTIYRDRSSSTPGRIRGRDPRRPAPADAGDDLRRADARAGSRRSARSWCTRTGRCRTSWWRSTCPRRWRSSARRRCRAERLDARARACARSSTSRATSCRTSTTPRAWTAACTCSTPSPAFALPVAETGARHGDRPRARHRRRRPRHARRHGGLRAGEQRRRVPAGRQPGRHRRLRRSRARAAPADRAVRLPGQGPRPVAAGRPRPPPRRRARAARRGARASA